MLSIIDYHMIGKSIAEFEFYCQVHPAKGIKFYCVTHNTPCCNICKEETHGIKCNVQLKDDILKITDVRGDMNAMVEAMTKMVENMQTEMLKDRWNVSDLEKQKTVFYDEMKNGRQLVENFLDKCENDEKEKFELAFSAAKETLCDNKRKIKHKLNVVQKRTETTEKIKESEFSEFKMFLIKTKFYTNYLDDQMQIESLLTGMKDVLVVARPTYDLNHQTKQITIRNGFEAESVGQSHVGKKQPEFDDIEFSSSTVEAEDGIVEENVQPERDIPLDGVKLTFDNMFPVKSNIYQLKEHFFIERRNKDISVKCIRFLSSDKIVLTEDSDSRILVYKTNGYKIGEVDFEEDPDEIAVIDETQVAVSVKKKVIFVDTAELETKIEKNLRDYISGLSYANQKIFACLQHKGVLIMGLSGKVIRTIPFIKGRLYICTTIDEIIYSVKYGKSNMFQCYDINRNKKEMYSFNRTFNVNGITCDIDGNIYLAIGGSEIIKVDATTRLISTLFTSKEDLKNPYNIDCCENGNRLLTIDNGKEVKIFQTLNS
ncbi:uncharacterized protein LOC134683084 isoform X2 [Mytilus trossulus]